VGAGDEEDEGAGEVGDVGGVGDAAVGVVVAMGDSVGTPPTTVGEVVGELDGELVTELGIDCDGETVGLRTVGDTVGELMVAVGDGVGGAVVGPAEGNGVGALDGRAVVGTDDGRNVGETEGLGVGGNVGKSGYRNRKYQQKYSVNNNTFCPKLCSYPNPDTIQYSDLGTPTWISYISETHLVAPYAATSSSCDKILSC